MTLAIRYGCLASVLFLSACQLNLDSQDKSLSTRGKVVGIADGDTFTFLTPDNQQEKVRLYGIDCPEKNQAFGQAARKRLSSLIFGKQVRLEHKGRDRYKRILALVWVEDSILVNTRLLSEGLAWHYDRYDSNTDWEALEQSARESKSGLWSEPAPTAPWDWRKGQN